MQARRWALRWRSARPSAACCSRSRSWPTRSARRWAGRSSWRACWGCAPGARAARRPRPRAVLAFPCAGLADLLRVHDRGARPGRARAPAAPSRCVPLPMRWIAATASRRRARRLRSPPPRHHQLPASLRACSEAAWCRHDGRQAHGPAASVPCSNPAPTVRVAPMVWSRRLGGRAAILRAEAAGSVCRWHRLSRLQSSSAGRSRGRAP